MSDDALALVAWPARRVGEAMEALARHHGMHPRDVEVPPLPDALERDLAREGGRAVSAWLEHAAAWIGVEAEPVDATWPSVTALLETAAPAVLMLPAMQGVAARCVLLAGRVRAGASKVPVLGVDLRVRRVPVEALRAAWCADLEQPFLLPTRGLLKAAGVPEARMAAATRALLRERLGTARVYGAWLLRVDPGESLARQLAQAGVIGRLGRMFAAQLALNAVAGLAWYILGRGAMTGTLDRAWLVGWGLTLVTTLPLQLAVAWHGGALAFDAGAVFKQRLLTGAIRLDPELVRHEGAGSMLGRVIESSAVEQNALSGATGSLAAVPAVLTAFAVLATGVGGALHAAVYALWLTLGVAVAVRYNRARRDWTVQRVAMTNDLVERMVGHRTRIAQEAPERWHDGEDKALERYVDASARLDRMQVLLTVLVPRGWTLVGVAALGPAMVSATAPPLALALGVGAVMVAGSALRGVTGGLVSLLGAGIAWREVAPLFHAAARRELPAAPMFALGGDPEEDPQRVDDAPTRRIGRTVLEAHDLVFRHAGRQKAVLEGVSLKVSEADRILLEGPSGGGKSTLGALLAGLRTPTSGMLLLHGLDVRSVGSTAWRRKVVAAPQFHENHVMTGTLAFNLLFGRRWPPTEDDLAEADAVCRELELGPLLDRMPSGMQQMVGEAGWRLSHGEQSRLFMARALLQGAEVVVLDESLAALDPETMKKALQCAFRRCPALVVIAHP